MTLRETASVLMTCIPLCVGSAATGMAATKLKTFSLPIVDEAAKKPTAVTGVAPSKAGAGMPLLPGSGSKEPITINSDKLDFLNKENKLIYTGNVVAVQGDSKLQASKLNIDLEKSASGGAASASADASPATVGNSSVRHMEAEAP